MQGLRNLILLTTGCILLTHVLGNVRNDGGTCLSKVQWRVLWKEIESLNNSIYSEDCAFNPRGNLCDPVDMITNVSNHADIAQVLQSILKLFIRAGNSFPNVSEFLNHIHQQYEHLRNCLQPDIDLSSLNARVAQCFQHMHEFLNNHPNTTCTWEMLSRDSLVMLQRLEQKKGDIL